MTFDIDLDADGGSPKLYIKSVESETLIVGVLHGEGNLPLNKEDLIFF